MATAAGYFALPREELATMLANCTAFQSATGTTSAAEARDFIYTYEVNDQPADFYAVIDDHPDVGRFRRIAAGSSVGSFTWVRGTSFGLAKAVPEFCEEEAILFDNAVSAIIQEILTLQGQGSYRRIDEIYSTRDDDGFLHRQRRDGVNVQYEYVRTFVEAMQAQ